LGVSRGIELRGAPVGIAHCIIPRPTTGGTSGLHNGIIVHTENRDMGATTVLFGRLKDQNDIRTIHKKKTYVRVLRNLYIGT